MSWPLDTPRWGCSLMVSRWWYWSEDEDVVVGKWKCEERFGCSRCVCGCENECECVGWKEEEGDAREFNEFKLEEGEELLVK